jgi:hypothetical protein
LIYPHTFTITGIQTTTLVVSNSLSGAITASCNVDVETYWCLDLDGDGQTDCDGDCDDNNPAIYS